jgi:hypothetical protein
VGQRRADRKRRDLSGRANDELAPIHEILIVIDASGRKGEPRSSEK